MFRHIFKMVWQRKGSNALIILEIFISFLVIFAVVAAGSQLYNNFRQPLGFDYNDLWDVTIATGTEDVPTGMEETISRLETELLAFDQVKGVASSTFGPYVGGSSTTTWGKKGFEVVSERMEVSLSYFDVLDMQLLAGRWFEPSDQHAHWQAVVISKELAVNGFGMMDRPQDAVGEVVVMPDHHGNDQEYRVVGVVDTFRLRGELQAPTNVRFTVVWLDTPLRFPDRQLAVRVAPGTTAEFEETMLKRLVAMAPDWSFEVHSVEARRDGALRSFLAPAAVVVTVAGFLMIMVALGLLGVLWQSVTRRTRELGLRRAKGATKAHIYRQISGELLMVAALGITLGTALVVQVPLLGILPISGPAFAAGLAVSAFLLMTLTAICGLYPSWLATRIQPAEALHYD